MKILFCFILLFTINSSALANTAQPGMIYRYWDWEKTPKRDEYQLSILRLALEKTKGEYGEFTIIRHREVFTTSRARREINRGEIVNIQAAPWRPIETAKDKLSERSLKVEHPVMKGLVGYRQLIIRKSDEQLFNSIRTESALKKLVAGQGRGWQDINIYRLNGYNVDDSANLPSLFPMLKSKRFDYFPMSIAEAASAISENPEYNQDFIIAPTIILYYPFPIIFYVTEKQPLLAERLKKGLLLSEADGSLDKLFNQFFSEDIEIVRKRNPNVFVLKNPYIPENLNQQQPLLFKH